MKEIITVIIAGLLGLLAGMIKVMWAFIYNNPSFYLAYDIVAYSLLAFFITMISKQKSKFNVFAVFMIPTLVVIASTIFDGIKRDSLQNIPTEWFITPFTILIAVIAGYKIGTLIKTTTLHNKSMH